MALIYTVMVIYSESIIKTTPGIPKSKDKKKKILSLSVTTNITVMLIPVADGDSLMMRTNLV